MVRPAEVCGALLAALDAAEGRRRSRKRDQTPDGIGLAIKRELLHRAVQENPDPDTFEEWLLRCAEGCSAPASPGAVSAMARAIFDEWSLAHSMNDFKMWLNSGAPSDDANPDSPPSAAPVSRADHQGDAETSGTPCSGAHVAGSCHRSVLR